MKKLIFILIMFITSCKPVLYTDFKKKDIKYPVRVVRVCNECIVPYSIIEDRQHKYFKLLGKTTVYKENYIILN